MVAIVTRAGKGSPLTNAEVDANFVNLNNGKLETASNLSDLADASAARTNLGLGSLATQNSITSLQVTNALGFTPANKAGDTFSGDVGIVGGRLLIGNTSLANGKVIIGGSLTGQTLMSALRAEMTIMSDVTAGARGYQTLLGTEAATWTLPDIIHYRAVQATFGAGSTVNSQNAFVADSSLSGAGTNIGFRGVIGSGASNWNIYMDGGANNYVAGAFLVGTTSAGASNIRSARNVGGGVSASNYLSDGSVQSDVTSAAVSYRSALNTAAASFTLGRLTHFQAAQGTIGAGSTVTTQEGFRADSSMVGAGTNIGFRGAIASGTDRWNLYMDGTAQNYLGGATILNAALGLGAVGSPSYGSAGQVLTSAGPGAVPTWSSPTGGVTSFNTRTGAITLSSGDVTGALGFTPYNSTNPNGYITSSGSISGNAATATSSNSANAKWTSAAIAGSQGSNVSAVEVRNNGGTGDSNLANITFHCQGAYGTSLHLRGDGYFGLGGWSASTWRWYVYLANGDMTAAGNITAYSDERLKKDWAELPDDFVEQLAQIRHGTYTRIDTGERQAGASAQSMKLLLPEVVSTSASPEKSLTLAYGNAALVSAIKLAQQVIELKARLNRLEQKVGA
jgi:hypothetical protein